MRRSEWRCAICVDAITSKRIIKLFSSQNSMCKWFIYGLGAQFVNDYCEPEYILHTILSSAPTFFAIVIYYIGCCVCFIFNFSGASIALCLLYKRKNGVASEPFVLASFGPLPLDKCALHTPNSVFQRITITYRTAVCVDNTPTAISPSTRQK